jgi:hypothetical protein
MDDTARPTKTRPLARLACLVRGHFSPVPTAACARLGAMAHRFKELLDAQDGKVEFVST